MRRTSVDTAVTLAVAVLLGMQASSRLEADTVDIGSRLELFVDDVVIDRMEGVDRRLHHPTPREVVLVHDQPWEGSGSGYHTVFRDGDLYRMYYRGWQLAVADGTLRADSHPPVSCYAESRDGIHWEKPELGIVECSGTKKNNIVWSGVGTLNFAPFLDANPGSAPDARYRALAGVKSDGGLFLLQSADGLHWSLTRERPVITAGAFDSQNLAFWDPVIGKYRAYWRTFTAGVTEKGDWRPAGFRAIRTATSNDLLDWGEPADLTYVDSPDEHLYTSQVAPYVRAPHILVGLPTRYIERGWSDSMKRLPDPEPRRMRAAAVERYGTALTEGLLMTSRDGVRFARWNDAFLRPGIERPGTWQYGQHFIACHLVRTASSLKGAPEELSLYALEDYWTGSSNALRRYVMRLDGFVSVHAAMGGGELLTKPLTFAGKQLGINLSTSAAGGIRIEIQDRDGAAIPGFALSDCPEIFGDDIERVVRWNGGPGLDALNGRPVRLRFVMRDADLYSFRFQDGNEALP